ncbi:MAG: ECF transporter S component [Oscillospiraceae bacterium]|nr:ECF transporter S component [Oscillospiraceae bacterium]
MSEQTMSEQISRAKSPRSNRVFLFQLSLYAMLTALIIVMTVTPIGYLNFGLLSITLIHLPVIVAAVTLGRAGGAAMGAVWGVTCVIKAIVAPPSPIEGIIFRNPVVAVLPRVLMGFLAGLIFWAMTKKGRDIRLSAGVSALCGALTNTVLTLSILYLWYHSDIGLGPAASFGGLGKFIGAAFAINAPVEIAAAVVLAVPVCVAVRRLTRRMA